MPSRQAIETILRDLQLAIDMGKFQPIFRRKNLETLAMLGLTWEDAKAEIYTLTADDYFQGPSVDRNFPASDRLWVFKKRIDGESIYIKFKVLYMEDGSVRVVSFHIDEP